MTEVPSSIQGLIDRFDPSVFDPGRRRAVRIRLQVKGQAGWDVELNGSAASLGAAQGEADAVLTADAGTWEALASDYRGGMAAYQSGRLSVRSNLHLGVGFLAATSGSAEPGRLRFHTVATSRARLSLMEAGTGPPAVSLNGLGGTKGSFLPTVSALADE